MTILTSPRARVRLAVACLWALVAFQLLIALLAWVDRDAFVTGMATISANRDAAEGSFYGSLLVHLLLAVLFAAGALTLPRGRRSTRIRISVPLCSPPWSVCSRWAYRFRPGSVRSVWCSRSRRWR